MDPLTIMGLIMAAGGGLAEGLGGLFSKETVPENINAQQTAQFQQLLDSLLQSNQDNLSESLNSATRTQEQIASVASKQGQITQQIGQLDAPEADDWFESFTQKYVPAYQAIASETASQASQMPNAQERADRASSQGVTAALDQFAGGGSYSGAAAGAATEAAVNPQLEYLSAVDQMFGNSYNSTFSNLASQGQGLAFQGQQNEFLNSLQSLTSQLSGFGQQGQTLGTQLQGSLGTANIFSNQQSNLMNNQAQLSQPVYATPSYTESPVQGLGTALGGIGNLFGAASSNNTLEEILKLLKG